jgi:hypothetical protein
MNRPFQGCHTLRHDGVDYGVNNVPQGAAVKAPPI